MTLSHFNRRLHLYLGLSLLPWFFMYGISSLPFAHNQFFEKRDAARKLPIWTVRLDRPLDLAVPEGEENIRALGASLMKEAGIESASYGVYRQSPTQVNVYAYSFFKATQVKYFIDRKILTVEDRRFRWDHFLTGMHARGGFEQEGVLQDSWSVIVDIVSGGMIVWIASGLYMWWGVRGHRLWGCLAILSGTLSFALFTWRL